MEKERQFDNFDGFAKGYRKTHNKAIKISGADSDYFSEYKIIELLKFEDFNQQLKILDFGCGDGNSVVFLRKHFPNASIVGVDVSEKSITISKNKDITNSTFTVFNGIKLPFKKQEFDIVFTAMVFHHIAHQFHNQVLADIVRVLKMGGRFYNFEHNPLNPFTRKVVRECEFDKDAVLLKPSYHRNLIINSGLTSLLVNYTLFFPRHKIFKIFLGLEKLLSWCPIGAQYYVRAVKMYEGEGERERDK
ncbi:MAG: class I SAM-dependent methyltransferase [Flavobacteriales bacterium CG_4_10_14_0_2_um_filter_32_8]|nr:MAG: class I SAM-dependent methyltransferase [Flavobacteriales bacterium CG_4_10_14_0_2_um_filter_32_8]PJB16092.1 MAG: class I SAM-dependent methyltransferase [Flavobacteriales bacterium CG_4_9_14_3_um_filter_32_8]